MDKKIIKDDKKYKIDVSDYEFDSFNSTDVNLGDGGTVRKFVFSDMRELEGSENLEKDEVYVREERTQAKVKDFSILPLVTRMRGHKAQEEFDQEKRIRVEVERRLEKYQERSRKKGFEEGIELGREEVFSQTKSAVEEKLSSLSVMINEVLKTQDDILNAQKKQIYETIKKLTKWVILRELSDDGLYLERLLTKLIKELQTTSNIHIKVNQKHFDDMPDILEVVQSKIGELDNVRVEVDYDIDSPGFVVECDNGIINGTLEQQLHALDKLFESVGIIDGEE